MYSICSYLMNICCERFFKLSRDEYLKIKEFIDNNIDIIESTLGSMNDYFDLVNIIARIIIIIRKKLDIFLLAMDIKNLMKKLENHILIFIT